MATMVVYVSLIRPDLERVDDSTCPASAITASDYNVQLNPAKKLTFDLEFAKTPTQQELGLSRRPCLPENAAVLFMFAEDDKFGIWMKEMKFPIDVVWLDKDKKIVTVEKHMKPESYPKVYYPSTDARYVIELNAGVAEKLGAAPGTTLNW